MEAEPKRVPDPESDRDFVARAARRAIVAYRHSPLFDDSARVEPEPPA